MKKEIIKVIFFLAAVTVSWTINVVRQTEAQDKIRMLTADREYWRMVASFPEVACRKRGGVYTLRGFATTFGRTPDQIHYECNQIKLDDDD